jgi:hypothetical protein
MKTFIHSIQKLPRPFINPLDRAALPFFFAMAFLPGILRLLLSDFPVTNPLAVLSPVAAGFWFAMSFREIRMNFALLGVLVTVLLWSANWLMMAGGDCCSTTGLH